MLKIKCNEKNNTNGEKYFMKKFISIFTIVTICIVTFSSCLNPLAQNPNELIIYEASSSDDFYAAFETTFFSSRDSKNVFDLISKGKQEKESGYRCILRYLNSNKYQEKSFGQIWKLGNSCFLIVTKNRHLYLSKSDKNLNRCYHILNNIDNYYVKEELPILNAPSTEIPDNCIIGDMTFANGQFSYLGEILFDKIYLGGIVTISNYQITTDKTKQFIATSKERTFLVTEKEHVFSYKQIKI